MGSIETASQYDTKDGIASGVGEKDWSYKELSRLARYPRLSACIWFMKILIVNTEASLCPKFDTADAFVKRWVRTRPRH